ncbi:pfkB-like carbohydrate kinase family protein [Artemisia annua]|uniref:PfkB-like carbohydrate kinase family protein n=1 Tax=Artemisia annua TaxID=35608 RepID=A0A2U1PJ03_ARTAN|nr:pfkB-like carbohydrate kinase family protein [Artemisia annua]
MDSLTRPSHRKPMEPMALVDNQIAGYRTTYSKNGYSLTYATIKVQGGGNAGNALTCAACLGLNARLMSKHILHILKCLLLADIACQIANDAQGKGVLEELQADGVDVSFFVVSEDGNSPFTYVIVDNQT